MHMGFKGERKKPKVKCSFLLELGFVFRLFMTPGKNSQARPQYYEVVGEINNFNAYILDLNMFSK